MNISDNKNRIFDLQNYSGFENTALEMFRFQCLHNSVYQEYVRSIKVEPQNVQQAINIPFLPIEFFKSHKITAGEWSSEIIFTSSGTTGTATSRHYVKSLAHYEEVFIRDFEKFYGSPQDYVILGLLPSYLEREGSSLIYMVDRLIRLTGNDQSGFYLHDHDELEKKLLHLEEIGQKTLLLGVTFALLDFCKERRMTLKNTIVMETGGMKGRGQELIREEVAHQISHSLGVPSVHSEYGMTELLSQGYSNGGGIFHLPPWMKVFVRETTDPLSCHASGTGALNIIDLANRDSCSFIATQDLGKVHPDGSFEVSGRFDHSDIRGCNLLVL